MLHKTRPSERCDIKNKNKKAVQSLQQYKMASNEKLEHFVVIPDAARLKSVP